MITITVYQIILLSALTCGQVELNLSATAKFDHIFKIQDLKCSPVSTGYKCTSRSPNFQPNACRTHPDACPSEWGCIDLQDGFLCRPHDDSNFGKQFKLWFHRPAMREKRDLQSSDQCHKMQCHSRATCLNGNCKCLKHYRGNYCDEEINYCKKNLCRNQIRCIPRVGGFTCDCPPNWAGKYCQHSVGRFALNMKKPDFLYQPFQYVGLQYHYIFHTVNLGFQPEVEVDFGDGTVLKDKHLAIHLKDAFYNLIRYFKPPVNLKSNKLELYNFKHAYSTPKVYLVHVRAWNNIYEVYNTNYEVHVSAVPKCTLAVMLRNAENGDKTKPLYLYRETALSITASAWSNCLQVKLKFQWIIHKLSSIKDELTPKNLYLLKKKVELQSPNLEIPSFTFDFGSYAVVLTVEMIKPKPGIKRKVSTWFHIKQKPIVAHIEGGKKIWIHTKAMFYLDASMSYDPNFAKDKQPPLTFTWTCRPKNKFCKGYYVLDETGPILVVPANVLEEQKYIFSVWVSSIDSNEVSNYTGSSSQEVQGVSKMVSFYAIRCIQNCVGGRANSMEIIALRGICISDPRNEREYKKSWIVYPNPDTNMDKGMRLDNSEFSKDNYYIVLYQQQLEAGQEFKFVFSGYNTETSTDVQKRNASFAELFITTYDMPEVGHCSVTPSEGYGMLTVFSVSCYNFLPGGDVADETLQYEVTQFNNLQDRAASGAFVGYDLSGTIKNITLAPGFRVNDYITTLRVTATNTNRLSTWIECNVTVFPLIYYFKRRTEVIERFVHFGAGSSSPLSLLLANENYYELVQQIISASFTLEQLLESQDSDSCINKEFLHNTLETVYHNFMSYLNQVPISSMKSLKHLATALEKVMNLPPGEAVWRSGSVMGVNILTKLIRKLEENIILYDEIVSHDDLDDIGVILVNIASNILKIPAADSDVLRADIIDPVNTLVRTRYVKTINPYDISRESLVQHGSNVVLDIIHQFMRLYMIHKVPNERTTLISGPELSILMKKAAPEFLTMKSLSVAGRVSTNLFFDRTLFDKNAFYNLEMIVMDDNPNWYDYNEPSGFRFPFVQINLTNEVDNSQVDADLEIYMKPIRAVPVNVYNGSLPIVLFWQIAEKHIQVHRIIIPKGGKLLVEFFPIQDKHMLEVVVNKNKRPKMSDFWYNAITIPQKVPKDSADKGLSIFVDDEIKEDKAFYYLGVLPHIDTLKDLMKHIEKPILPRAFHPDVQNEEDLYYDEHADLEGNAKVRNIRQLENSTNNNSQALPYSFIAHCVYCVAWDEANKHWQPNCTVKSSTTSARVTCNCTGHAPITVSFHRASVRYQKYIEFRYSISYYDNPLIIFLVAFTSILFIGLFAWAAGKDYKDNLKQTVCFLVDNYPQCEYCYLVIIQTGRLIKAETTANVTIELEGTNATSLPHVLKDWRHEVLGRGDQNWFVLKTMKPLGEIYCLHIWTDYSGSKPSWYCSRILVHDIQEQQIWFFNVEKWFDPIHGDGSMSYTIYQSTDSSIFSAPYHLKEGIIREFDSGMHGWFSIFYKHPYNNFTRKQRVAVAYLHMTVMMVILVSLNDAPLADSPRHQIYKSASYEWESNDLFMAVCTVLIAFPIHNLFVWLFRCIKPSSQWTESIFDNNLSRFNIQTDTDDTWVSSGQKITKTNIQAKERSRMTKSVSFSEDYDEPAPEHKLRSRYSMEKLEKGAGRDKVVPLRMPTSKIETEAGGDVFSPDELNTPVYGREIVTQSYCFPSCFVYITWILLFIVEIPCIYIAILYGVSYGWIFSLHYLTSLFLAIVLSMFLLEPLKLFCWSFYLFVYNKREYAIEDRSDLVETLNPQFSIPPELQNQITEKINTLRQGDMYTPLADKQLHTLKRNRVVSFFTRMILAEFMLLMLFMLLLCTMIYNIFDPLTYLQYRNVKDLVMYSQTSRRNSLADVQIQEDLVHYLRHTLIANLHYSYDKELRLDTHPSVDDVNHLVGVIQLRQIRRSPSACRPRLNKWSSRCINIYDNTNYMEGWTKTKRKSHELSPDITKKSWLYKKRRPDLKTAILHGNETRYPAGSYVATLGKTKAESVMALDYLAKNNWFDHLTTVVYVDFVLYNPHMHYLSMVMLMAERTEQGRYYLHNDIDLIQMNPVESNAQLLFLVLIFALFVWLIFYINKESKKYSLVQPKQVFSHKWNRMKKFLLFLGITNVAIYISVTLSLERYHEDIAMAANQNFYPNFRAAEFWDQCLKVLIAFMFFLVILDLCHILNMIYRIKRAYTAVCEARRWTKSYCVLAIVLIASFTWAGYVLFSVGSYDFQSFNFGVFSLINVFLRSFGVRQFGNINQIPHMTFLYCLTLVVLIIFIFRCLMATIVIHSYSAVKRNARSGLHQSVLSRYTQKYFDTIDTSPNRKPVKLILYLYKIEPRMRGLGFLFIDLSNRTRKSRGPKNKTKPRIMAMDAIALDIVRKRHGFEKRMPSTLTEKYQRKEQAKALARTIIFLSTLKNKLDYLNAKLDVKIREARHEKLMARFR